MASMCPSRFLRPDVASTKPGAILSFLVPAAHFSTSPARRKRDNNRNRGLSAVRRTGLRSRQTLSIKQKDFENQELPKPVPIEVKPRGDPDHGLWDFFKNKELLQTPMVEQRHGRAWTVGELRNRDWGTLHQLWWVCVKERNRLATEKIERSRIQAGYGDLENQDRDKVVQETMKAILDTLAERQVAYTEAYELAQKDKNIDLSRKDGPQFTAPAYDPYEPEYNDTASATDGTNRR